MTCLRSEIRPLRMKIEVYLGEAERVVLCGDADPLRQPEQI